jgi:uncharacterized phage protein gp47/JayE
MYEDQTKTAILQRMLDASPADIDKRQGAPTYDLLSPAAIELALAYANLDNNIKFGFADTTYGTYLDRRVGEHGVTRKPAVKATGSLKFTGANGTVIPAGTRCSTADAIPIYFVTTTSGTISGGNATVTAEAETAGAAGNVAVGTITRVTGTLSGVINVTNPADFTGGVDTESDADLLARYLDYVRRPATSGNANQYRQWALEVSGISDAKVTEVWNGPGTVKVVLLDTDKTAPDASLVTSVADHIESVRPVGATVTVVGATEVPINVSATLTLDTGKTVADVQGAIETGIVAYLKTLAFVDPIVRYSQIANVILDVDGVLDYANLTVNGGTANITIADGSVAVIGSVTLT